MGSGSQRKIDLNVAPYTFLDIEASGLDQADSYPIEIAWSDTLGNHDVFLIRPSSCWVHWDERAEAVHGIARETLLGNGIPLREAAERLNESSESKLSTATLLILMDFR